MAPPRAIRPCASLWPTRWRAGDTSATSTPRSSTPDSLGLRPSFVAPELDRARRCPSHDPGGARPGARRHSAGAVAAVAVSPTYFGACADVQALAEVAHGRGVPLVVGRGLGAHLRFDPELPPDAISSGADLVISSTHKIVGSLTQAAMLHLASERIDEKRGRPLRQPDRVDQPSGLLCGSLDAGRRQAYVHGEELLAETIGCLEETREAIRGIPGLDVLDERMVGSAGVAGWDPLRLAVDVRGTGSSGYRLAELVRDDDDVNFELFAENVAVAAFGMGAPAAPQSERLVAALRRAVEQIGGGPRPSTPSRSAAPLGRAGDDAARGLPRAAAGGAVRRGGGPGGGRAAGGVPARDPQRAAGRATVTGGAGVRHRERRPRRLRAGRHRPRAEDAAGRQRADDELLEMLGERPRRIVPIDETRG